MTTDDRDVCEVNLDQRFVVLDDNTILQITNILDHRGDEATWGTPLEFIKAVVAGPDDLGKWWTIDMSCLERVKPQ